MPYRHSLEEYSRQQSLDPFLVAALIRQESEFNTKAVSRANARGLTQVMPSTGRQLSRQLKIPRYSTSMLFKPDMNLKIGTFYLKALSDQLQGSSGLSHWSDEDEEGSCLRWRRPAFREELVEEIGVKHQSEDYAHSNCAD